MASSGSEESQDSSLFDSSRFFSNAGVKICESSIKNAGRGLAVDGAVASRWKGACGDAGCGQLDDQ